MLHFRNLQFMSHDLFRHAILLHIVYLTLLFNPMIHHCFGPNDFCNGIILPVLKSKRGDATKVDMHRTITLSSVISKCSNLYDNFLSNDSLPYGFKKNRSCSHALFTVSE